MSRPFIVKGSQLFPKASQYVFFSLNVNVVNTSKVSDVETVNTASLGLLRSFYSRPRRKPTERDHDGNLRRALLEEALRTAARTPVC
jgi:hypothetical protein